MLSPCNQIPLPPDFILMERIDINKRNIISFNKPTYNYHCQYHFHPYHWMRDNRLSLNLSIVSTNFWHHITTIRFFLSGNFLILEIRGSEDSNNQCIGLYWWLFVNIFVCDPTCTVWCLCCLCWVIVFSAMSAIKASVIAKQQAVTS